MKFILLLAAASQFATGRAHGPGKKDDVPMAPTQPAAPASVVTPGTSQGKATTPAGCNRLATDAEWPTDAEWKKAFPEVIARSTTLPKGVTRPDYRIRAESYSDVQAAVKFCAKHKIRLTIINSGHDFLGRNDAPSGLSLDTSLLSGITVLEEFNATVTGAPKPGRVLNTIVPVPGKQAAATFGVGISSQKLHNAVGLSKLVTIGAAHGSVSPAGGFGQTAGHGPITPLYGLGVDQFLEFKVVTADGELRVANKVVNSDLFWALRGGGGSTFGVVVEATVKAYPDVTITLTNFWFNATGNSSQGLWDAYSYLHTQLEDLSVKGVSGYYYIYPTSFRAAFLTAGPASGEAKARAIWEPVLTQMASYPNVSKARVEYVPYNNYKAYFDARFGAIDKPHKGSRRVRRHGPDAVMDKAPEPQGISPLDSRLLGAQHFKHPNLTQILMSAAPTVNGRNLAGLQGHLVAGGKVAHPDDDTSVLPAWRKSLVHMIGSKTSTNPGVESLRKLAPESGAYANEAHPYEANWKQSFWGSNYPKLSQIKTKYDPNMVFWVTPGINADLMEVREGRVCKATTPRTDSSPPKGDNPNSPRLMTGTINRREV